METLNVVSTPQITGNIGSCTTQSVKIASKRISFAKEEITTLATNSCTGQIERFVTWEFTEVGVMSAFAALFVGCVIIWAIIQALVD